VAIACLAVQVVIWHSFYAADPWRIAGPLAAVLWAVVVVFGLARRSPGWKLAVSDCGFHVALALGAQWCVPPAMRGDTANWLYIVLAAQVVVPAWYAPTAVFVPLALASGSAYWAGTALSTTGGTGTSAPAAACALLVTLSAVSWWGRRMLLQRAAIADAALAEADRDSRAQYVVLSRSIERREHERLLHDTVLNTLTALTRAGGGDPAGVVGRCRQDVALMESALRDPGCPAEAGQRPHRGLVAGIECAATDMGDRGLQVHVRVSGGGQVSGGVLAAAAVPGGPRSPAAGDEVLAVPVAVADAMVHAVREALVNVASHGATSEAWVEINLAAPAGDVAAPGGFEVTVRDAGAGFDPVQVGPGRLGLRRSIVERLADCGGQAIIRSAPGEGTVVRLGWRTPADPPQALVADATADRPLVADATADRPHVLPSRSGAVRDAYEAELPRVAVMVAAIWQVTLLIQVVIFLHDYRQPAVPIAVWLGMLVAAGWLMPRARVGRFAGADALIAIAVAVTAVVLLGWDRRANGLGGTADWSVIGTGWLLALVALSRPAWVWGSAAVLVFAAHAVLIIHALGMTPLWLARLAATGYTVVVILAVFAALRPAVRTYAAMATRRASLASRSAAERAAADAVHVDRLGRLALLDRQALPLLRGIAGGTLDPADGDVREQCARQAAALRQALVDRSGHEGRLLAEMEPVLSAARARGVPVEVRVVGDPGHPPAEVTGATLAAVSGVMNTLPPHPVTLTVIGSQDAVEVYMTFDSPPQTAPDVTELERTVPATLGWRAAVDVDDSGTGCLAIRWRKAVLV
jgi:signal transduction histidine kinase